MDLSPSPVTVKLVPVPVVQLVPPLVLYCQVAPVSRPETLTVPLLVMLSLVLPLLVARASVGLVGGVLSWLLLEPIEPTATTPTRPARIAPIGRLAAPAVTATSAATVLAV